MKITSLIFKHFRCNARNTKISFAESCVVKFSHWSHCSDVLDALSYTLYGEYYDKNNRMSYGSKESFYQTIVEIDDENKHYSFLRKAPSGIGKDAKSDPTFVVKVVDSNQQRQYFSGSDARHIRDRLVGSKSTFFSKCLITGGMDDLVHALVPTKQAAYREVFGTDIYHQAEMVIGKEIRYCRKIYSDLLVELRQTMANLNKTIGGILPSLDNGTAGIKSSICSLGREYKKLIAYWEGTLQRVHDIQMRFRCQIEEIKKQANPQYLASQIRYARYSKQDILKLSNLSKRIDGYSRNLTDEEATIALSQTMRVVAIAQERIEGMIQNYQKEKEFILQILEQEKGKALSDENIAEIEGCFENEYFDAGKMMELQDSIGRDTFEMMNTFIMDEQCYRIMEQDLEAPFIDHRTRYEIPTYHSKYVYHNYFYSQGLWYADNYYQYLVSHWKDKAIGTKTSLVEGNVEEMKDKVFSEFSGFDINTKKGLSAYRKEVQDKNVCDRYVSHLKRGEAFLRRILSDLFSLKAYISRECQKIQRRMHRCLRMQNQIRPTFNIDELHEKSQKEGREIAELISSFDAEVRESRDKEELSHYAMRLANMGLEVLSIIEEIEQRCNEKYKKCLTYYNMLAENYRRVSTLTKFADEIRTKTAYCTWWAEVFSGERDFSGLHKKMVGIPLEVEKQIPKIPEVFRETERLFFNLLGKEIHLFLSKQKRRKGYVETLDIAYKKEEKDEKLSVSTLPIDVAGVLSFCYMLALNHYGIQHNGKPFTTILFIDKAFDGMPRWLWKRLKKLMEEEKETCFVWLPSNRRWATMIVEKMDKEEPEGKEKEKYLFR